MMSLLKYIYAPKLAINYSFCDNSMGAFTKPGAIWVLSPTYLTDFVYNSFERKEATYK